MSEASPPRGERVESSRILLALIIVLSSAFFVAIHFHSYFQDDKFRGVLLSSGMRDHIRTLLPRAPTHAAGEHEVSLAPIFGVVTTATLGVWIVGALLLAAVSRSGWRLMLWRWGRLFLWLWLIGVFEGLWSAAGSMAGSKEQWFSTLLLGLPFLHSIAWGGWIATGVGLATPPDRMPVVRRAFGHAGVVWGAAILYAVTFSVLSILQYRALMVPHGDSAMYEEHLWNLLHGKGFRSQLDGGRLFFGEHLEVIHVLLLPIYVFFPSLPTLNVCQSVALASGAIAVRGITRRLTDSNGAANWLGVAYLLYFPTQFLNLEMSLKTFRPENMGVPLLLFAIWALEARRFRTMLVLVALVLVCKEDYAIPVGMMGLFLLVRRNGQYSTRGTRWLGLGLWAFAVVYLVFVLAVFIPAFRDGPPHYMAYYGSLGHTPAEVITTLIRKPGVLFESREGLSFFALTLLGPIAFLPLLGVGRLWLALPTLLSIVLIELRDARSPFFHFHAPLVPVLFWAAAEGLRRLSTICQAIYSQRGCATEANAIAHRQAELGDAPFATAAARWAACCALVSGLFFGKSPLSFNFYDPHTEMRGFAGLLYFPRDMPLDRVRFFERLFSRIPSDSIVAATDFVRPRFTHHRECHQYGAGGLKPHVDPETIDYIVVDLFGPYSDWAAGHRLREVEEHPDRWEVLSWDPEGEWFFHVVKSKRSPAPISTTP